MLEKTNSVGRLIVYAKYPKQELYRTRWFAKANKYPCSARLI